LLFARLVSSSALNQNRQSFRSGARGQFLVKTRRISVLPVPQTMPESSGSLPSAINREAQDWAALRGVAPPPAKR
jgi:hypothetical protein